MEGTRMTGDPLALWRHKDPLSFNEAAAMLHGEPPGRTYDRRDTAQRHADDLIKHTRAMLWKDATLPATRPDWHVDEKWRFNEFDRKHHKLRDADSGPDYENGSIARADVISWAEKRRLDLAAFRDPQDSGTRGAVQAIADPDEINPTREKTLLRVIAALVVMAKLPDRGATDAVLKQLGMLGFNGPGATKVREALQAARCLPRDEKRSPSKS